jgi:hypothetical protein
MVHSGILLMVKVVLRMSRVLVVALCFSGICMLLQVRTCTILRLMRLMGYMVLLDRLLGKMLWR